MSKFLNDNNDDAKAIALSLVFFESSRAKNLVYVASNVDNYR